MVDCAICGKPVDEDSYGPACENVRSPRRYLHEACKAALIAQHNESDAFSCKCRKRFTPDSFHFQYIYQQGGMGDAFHSKLGPPVCPDCSAPMSGGFEICAFCGGGASLETAVKEFEHNTAVYYHDACKPQSRRLIAQRLAAASAPPPRRGWLARLLGL
jgi:hypothetical protein